MLPRTHRIQTEYFPGVTRGKTFQGDVLRVVIRRDDQLKNPKCAVIVPNKVAKTAVARNRLRRQVYEALQGLLPSLPVGFVSVFPRKASLTSDEVAAELRSFFHA